MGYAVGDRILIPAEVVEARDRGHIGLRVGTQIVLLAESTLDAHVERRPLLTAEQASLLGAYTELRDDNLKLSERVVELELQAQLDVLDGRPDGPAGDPVVAMAEIAGVNESLLGPRPDLLVGVVPEAPAAVGHGDTMTFSVPKLDAPAPDAPEAQSP